MGHILWVEPVFKEMIWGGNQLKKSMAMLYQVIKQENVGHLQHIQMVIIKSKKVNSKDKLYQKSSNVHCELFGNIKDKQFPLLVKIIDACND